ncbi:MAG: hypothetical protein HOP08_15030 [Cyclobacteriaceae bacterium]|nr:hypothetical protein [Cyclobacteriaceae bacterium]
MLEKPLIYVGRITNLSDARYCAGMGVDMLGFSIDPSSEDYVSPKTYQEIIGWVSGPKRVIEISGEPNIKWDEIMEQYKPDLIHLSYTRSNDTLPDIPVILELTFSEWMSDQNKLSSLPLSIQHVLVKDVPAEFNDTFDSSGFTILLALDSTTTEPLSHFLKAGVDGFALQGTKEEAPGLKDYDHLSRILEELDE